MSVPDQQGEQPRADQDAVRAALAVYEGAPGHVSIDVLARIGGPMGYTRYSTTGEDLDRAARDVVKADFADEPVGIYVRGTTVDPDSARRGLADESVAWVAIRADLDLGKPGGPQKWNELFDAFGRTTLPSPTEWQHSGRGYYPLFRLAAPVPDGPEVRAAAKAIENELRRAWAESGFTAGVDACADAARVWRLAGTVHRKDPDSPVLSTVGKPTGRVFTLAELVADLPEVVTSAPVAREPGEQIAVTETTARAHFAEEVDRVRATIGAEHRYAQHNAWKYGYQLADAGLATEDEVADKIDAAIRSVWGAGPDRNDAKHRETGRDAAREHPLSISVRPLGRYLSTPAPVGYPDGTVDHLDGIEGATARAHDPEFDAPEATVVSEEVPHDDEGYALALDKEVHRERLRRDARALLAAEDVDALSVLDSESFLDSAATEYLVPGVLYRNSTAKLYGPPGETKSFLALDLALSIAVGRPWFGNPLSPLVVHYVMAEGQAVNVGRTLAWLHHHGVDRAKLLGRFSAVPQGVLLTPEGVATYIDQVRRDRPSLVVLDTKNAMMAGEENSASDVAVMVRAMRAIRDAAEGACVLLIDHTGLSDTTRGRGSNAVTGAMDSEVQVSLDRATGMATAQVTRDKDAEPGEAFTYRLESVTDVPSLQGRRRPPAVVVPVGGDGAVPFGERREWWLHVDPTLVPADVAALSGPGADAARDIFRVLAFMDEEVGVTAPVLLRAINQRPGADYSEPTCRRGRKALERAGVVEVVSTGKYALAGPYQGAAERV